MEKKILVWILSVIRYDTFIFLLMGILLWSINLDCIANDFCAKSLNPLEKHSVRGKIIDGQGGELIGASVIIKGTSIGALSDINGEFVIEVDFNTTLVVSYIGFETQEILVVDDSYVMIEMQESGNILEELVVSGYGNPVKKESLINAISNISSEKLSKSSATHTSSALAGKVAGVNFRMTNGEPGKYSTLSIRNMGAPLYVIDGLQSTEDSFNNLDFNDIESISVLKDASAAIYGVQSGKGVVVVTTKKGKRSEKNTVNVSSYYGAQSWFRFPKPAGLNNYISSHIQSDVITGSTPKFTIQDLKDYENRVKKGFDWYKYVVKDYSPQYYVSANVSGGSDKINYYVSLGYLNQNSIIRNYGNFERYNTQINLDIQVTDKFKIGTRFNGRYESLKHPAVPGDDVWAAIFAIYRNLPINRPYANDNPKYPAITSNTMSTNFAILNYDLSGIYENKVRVGQISLNAEYQITKDVKITGLAGYYLGNVLANNQEYTYSLYSYDKTTDTYPEVYHLSNPFRQRIVSNQEQLSFQSQLIFHKKINQHLIDLTFVGEAFREKNPGFDTWSRPESNAISWIDYESLEQYNDYGDREIYRVGFASRFNYDFQNKYLLEFAFRYDGSWKFAPGKRWGFFPSFSLGWRISEEDFWKDKSFSNIFSNLKIRASYGLLGDDNVIDPHRYLTGYTYGEGGATLDGEYIKGTISRGLPITSISWIDIKLLDIGLDFGFFNNKLSGSIDYFRRKADGIAASKTDVLIPSEAGFTIPEENLESDIHTGFDMEIQWHDKINEFAYSIGANITYSRYYTWKQYKPRFENSWDEFRNSKWKRFSNITWGYLSDGQFNSWDEINQYPIDIDGKGNSTLRPGDIKYKDLNGDNKINDLDQRPIGYGQGILPDLNFGLNMQAAYRNFELSLNFAGGAQGTYKINYELRNPFWDGGNSANFILENQWRLSDITDPHSELIPGKYPTALIGNSNHSNYWESDFWYKNVSYMKLKYAELGYNLPKKWSKGIKSCKIYLFGENLFSIDNVGDYEIDPEIANESGLAYPTNRNIGVGIKVSF